MGSILRGTVGGGKKLRGAGTLVLVLAGALGVILLLLGGMGGETGDGPSETVSEEHAQNDAEALERYVGALEAKIAELCGSVAGVSDVRVAVTLASGYEYVYAKDTEEKQGADGATGGSSHYVTVGSGAGESVVYLSERPPVIGGIGIVCRGGGRDAVRRELLELLSAAFGVPSNRIYVTEGGT